MAATLTSNVASASVFGFADDPDVLITSYNGFTFGNGSAWVNGTLDPISLGGKPAAPSAPLGYAWSNAGMDLTMTLASPGTFTFNSIDVYGSAASWGGSPEPVTIEGFKSGVLVDTLTTIPLDSMPRNQFTTIDLNWTGIDEVLFSTSYENLLLTNVTINEAVPEPSTWAMMLLGFLGVGFMAYRKRSTVRFA